jgi:PAS domain S-box-containing protein
MELTPELAGRLSPEESEERYRSVVSAMAEGAIFQDLSGRIEFCNPSAEQILGHPAAEIVGKTPQELGWKTVREDGSLLPASDHPAMVTLRTGQSCSGVIMGLKVCDEPVTWISVNSEPLVRRGETAPYAVVSTFADVTWQREAESALKAREKLFRTLVENQSEGIGIVDRDERFLIANPAGEEIFGVPRGGLAGRCLLDFVAPGFENRVLEETQSRSDGKRSKYELEIIREADGATRIILVSATPQIDEAGNVSGTFGVFSDITELKEAEAERERLQAQFQQSQKMESVGRLAGGIAHDFNNLLTVINGYSSMVLERMSPSDPARPRIAEVYRAGESAAALVRQLLAFSRKQVLRRELLDLNHMVGDMEKMLARLVGEDIEILTRLVQPLWRVLADRHQMEQVVMNLAVNARDAMPQGGSLFLETAHVLWPGSSDEHGLPEVQPGPHVRLTVRDTGTGIDAHTRQHLFEPFFTTKEAGQGTGLGLATVHGIVLQSGGHIEVQSELGTGTAFHVYLPAVEARPDTLTRLNHSARASGPATILLVEDQEEVRQLTAVLLREQGYVVLEASGGEEALEHCADERIDLLLTDVVMPKMSGSELAARLRSCQPMAKVVFMSGYSDEALAWHAGPMNGGLFLQKPYGRDELTMKVREALYGR